MSARRYRHGGILAGLLRSALAILCLCAAGGIYFARNVRVSDVKRDGGTDVSIDTPAGRLNVHARDSLGPVLAGIPEYPGARRRNDSGGAVVEWEPNDGRDGKNFAVAAVEFETADSADRVADRVADWYRSRLPNWTVVKKRGKIVRLELAEGGYKRIVAVEERQGHTRIAIASADQPAAN